MTKRTRVPIAKRALLARINRKLRPESLAIKATRGERARPELGDYYELNTDRRLITGKHVDLEVYGREIGCLAEWEGLADD